MRHLLPFPKSRDEQQPVPVTLVADDAPQFLQFVERGFDTVDDVIAVIGHACAFEQACAVVVHAIVLDIAPQIVEHESRVP